MTSSIMPDLTLEDIKKFIDYKKMRLPGKGVTLKPLYELVMKCKQSKGVLYVLGSKEDIIPKYFGEALSRKIREHTLSYHLITLPERVSVLKACCGSEFVIILSHVGGVYSWGTSACAALGKNRAPNFSSIKPIPELCNREVFITDIAAGTEHCLALTTAHTILVWGNGDFGKLGNCRNDNVTRPETISIENSDIELIRAGHNSSFCMTKQKECYFWGEAAENKFGNDSGSDCVNRPQRLSYDFEAADAAIGEHHCVIVTKGGTLAQFGEGQLGHLSKNKTLEGVEFYKVCGHGRTFLAISNKGSIYSWKASNNHDDYTQHSIYLLPDSIKKGKNAESDPILGRDVESNQSVPTEISYCFQQFPAIEEEGDAAFDQATKKVSNKIAQVVCAEANTFLISDKGEVLITGNNTYGQMAIAHGDIEEEEATVEKEEYSEFTLIPRLSIMNKVFVESLACGTYHIIAIIKGKKALSWGANNSGQLGLKYFSHSQKYPAAIEMPAGEEVSEAAAGKDHSMLLTTSGTVYSFGSAENGKLGQGFLKPSVLINEPRPIPELLNIKRISCGDTHSLAIDHEKTLFLWGEGWKGQLGSGSKENAYSPTPLLSNLKWKRAACGSSHTVALTAQGRVYHWGHVYLSEEESELLQPLPVKGIEEITIRRVYAADGHSAALIKNNASVYVWGQQMKKRLLGAKLEEHQLAKVTNASIPGEKIASFSINTFHGGLVTVQGNVFTWGYALAGRIGCKPEDKTRTKAFNGVPVNLTSYTRGKNDNPEENTAEEVIFDLQQVLQSEPEELNEANIREMDQQICVKFNECIDKFVQLTTADKQQEQFFSKVEYKMLTRLEQEPLNCRLMVSEKALTQDKEEKLLGYASFITTYQIHTCYMYKLLTLRTIDDSKKLDMLSLIYADMENDNRLIYTSIYLAKKLLSRLLSKPELTFQTFLQDEEAIIYKAVMNRIIVSSTKDMEKISKMAEAMLQSIGNIVHDDANGIDPDPMRAFKNNAGTASNKITAYQLNRNTVDKRVGKLKQVMATLTESLNNFVKNGDNFSSIIALIVKDFLSQCGARFGLKIKKFDHEIPEIQEVAHILLSIIFEPLWTAIEKPSQFYVVVENKAACSNENLKSLSSSVKSFFTGAKIANAGERWLKDIDTFNTENTNSMKLKIEVLEILQKSTPDIEELFLKSMFKHSLASKDVEISVPGSLLVSLHAITSENLEELRVNNPSYDPLALLCKSLKSVPSSKLFYKNECVNLQLFTRALRQDQSIVRCPYCEMLISRDMAPSNFKQVIEVYDPMPPNSPVSLFTKILATGHKKVKKVKVSEYLKQYESVFFTYLKDYKTYERVNALLQSVDTLYAANNHMAIDTEDPDDRNLIEKNREIYLKDFEKECEKQYLRRKHHCELQSKLTRIFNTLLKLLEKRGKKSKISEDQQRAILFNVEYGASNRDLEKFSDSVMFSLFMNKIREYTTGKDMSINLFENLTSQMKNSLEGFMKLRLSDLVRKKIVKEYTIFPKMKPAEVIFSFEIGNDFLTIIVAYSKSKLNICGRDEFREEELLLYEKISSDKIGEMREKCKGSEEDIM